MFFGAQEGWQAWDNDTGQLLVLQGGVWETTASSFENLPGLGINATSDATNRLSVAAQATLLSHDGAGHQLKLNKASTDDTASLLYQSGFNGHAEMGLAGDNDFHIKVSPDSARWTEALVVDSATGLVSGAAVQATAADITAGRLARADFVYGPGNVLGTVTQSGGVPTGAVIETGSNASGYYIRFADGTQICTQLVSIVSTAAGTPTDFIFHAAFTDAPYFASINIDQEIGGVNVNHLASLNLVGAVVVNSLRWRTRFVGYSGTDIGTVSFTLFAFGRWF